VLLDELHRHPFAGQALNKGAGIIKVSGKPVHAVHRGVPVPGQSSRVLPPGHAEKYVVRCAQQFLVIATDMAASLVRGRTHPPWLAQKLAVRCLLDQVEVIQDPYGLDLADGWRGQLEERMLEDTDS
jgi:hypothetical protein